MKLKPSDAVALIRSFHDDPPADAEFRDLLGSTLASTIRWRSSERDEFVNALNLRERVWLVYCLDDVPSAPPFFKELRRLLATCGDEREFDAELAALREHMNERDAP